VNRGLVVNVIKDSEFHISSCCACPDGNRRARPGGCLRSQYRSSNACRSDLLPVSSVSEAAAQYPLNYSWFAIRPRPAIQNTIPCRILIERVAGPGTAPAWWSILTSAHDRRLLLSFPHAYLVVGQPFQAVVLTGWKAGPTRGISGSVARAGQKDQDSSRGSLSGTGFQPVDLTGWKPVPLGNDW
jgi:hypothetical protein